MHLHGVKEETGFCHSDVLLQKQRARCKCAFDAIRVHLHTVWVGEILVWNIELLRTFSIAILTKPKDMNFGLFF